MPDPFEGLLVVVACAGCIADDAGIQQAVMSQGQTEVHELLAPVAGVTAQHGGGQSEAAVPSDWAGQAPGGRFHLGAAVARVQDQGFDVLGEVNHAVDMGFDVVIERLLVVRLGQVD
jgi:hypothetical protein